MVITLNLPSDVEQALQRKAAEEGKSLDRVTLDVLAKGLEIEGKKRDLSFLTKGTPLEPEVLQSLEEQRKIDHELWCELANN